MGTSVQHCGRIRRGYRPTHYSFKDTSHRKNLRLETCLLATGPPRILRDEVGADHTTQKKIPLRKTDQLHSLSFVSVYQFTYPALTHKRTGGGRQLRQFLEFEVGGI